MERIGAGKIRAMLSTALAATDRTVLSRKNFQRAAVLVPLIDDRDKCMLLFTKRTETVETHKGQVSFPGGVVDGTDRDPVHTALRETHEELGILPETVEPLGLLDDIATPVGFVITPVVGFLPTQPTVVPNAVEVAEVFQMPLEFFADPQNGRREFREVEGHRYEVWFYEARRHLIWGATARIVRMVIEKLEIGT